MLKHELTTGDMVLARIGDDLTAFEFYGWWDDNRQICCLVVPHNGLTVLAPFYQILTRVTGSKVIKLNNECLRRWMK